MSILAFWLRLKGEFLNYSLMCKKMCPNWKFTNLLDTAVPNGEPPQELHVDGASK